MVDELGQGSSRVQLPGESAYPARLAISGSGRQVAIALPEKVLVKSVASRDVPAEYVRAGSYADCISFSPTEDTVVVVADASALTFISLRTGRVREVAFSTAPLPGHRRQSLRAAYSRDGRRLVVGGIQDEMTSVVVLDARGLPRLLSVGGSSDAESLSADGSVVAIARPSKMRDGHGRIELISLVTKKTTQKYLLKQECTALDFSPTANCWLVQEWNAAAYLICGTARFLRIARQCAILL